MSETKRPAKVDLSNLSLGDVVENYFGLLSYIDGLNSALSSAKKSKEEFDKVILERLEASGLTSVSGKLGRVERKEDDRYSIENYDKLCQYVLDSGRVALFQRRLTQTYVAALLEEYKELPPGVKIFTEVSIKASAKRGTDE